MLKKIKPSALKIGHYIDEIVGSNFVESGLKKNGKVYRQPSIDKLLKLKPDYFVIDISRGLDVPDDDLYHPEKTNFFNQTAPQNALANAPFTQEINRAKLLMSQAKTFVSDILQHVKEGAPIDIQNSHKLSSDILSSVTNNAAALLCLSRIRQKDSYLLEHSIHVATLCAVFCRFLKIDEHQALTYITGALLHDIGKVYIPDDILHKPSALNEFEWKVMRLHPTHSETLLGEIDDINYEIIQIGAQHHERWDGGGYPLGLTGDDINFGARITALCDVYDALTAHRCYKQGMNPSAAMKLILSWCGDHFETSLCHNFIHCMGVFPIGSFVELDNQIGAIVVEHKEHFQYPDVLQVWDFAQQQSISPKLINLFGSQHKISQLADAEILGIDCGKIIDDWTHSFN